MDDDFVNCGTLTQAKVQTTILLRCEPAASGDLLHLLLPVPLHRHLRSYRAAIALRSLQIEANPVVLRRHSIFVEQQPASLIRNDHVERPLIPEVGHGNRPAILCVRYADHLCYVYELASAIIQPYMLLLVARKTAALHSGPVLCVPDDGGIASRDFGKVIPVISLPIQRNIAIRQEKIERAVVVQIAKLCAEAPSSKLHAHVARQVFILDLITRGPLLRHPKIIPLDQNAILGDVRHVDREFALIKHVSKRDVHPTLRRKADTRFLARLMEALAVVHVELGHAVVVRDEQVSMSRPAQVGGGSGQGPVSAINADLGASLFKSSVAKIVKQVFAASIFGILKAVRHHAGVYQMPEIDVFRVVSTDKQVE